MSKTLYTRWGRELDPEHVLQEYPRPGLVRDSYLNLNGFWDYAITKSEKLPENHEGNIRVPFSPEAPLSGVNRQLQPEEYLHYRRNFRVAGEKQACQGKGVEEQKYSEESDGADSGERNRSANTGRWLLHFGAVDQSCTVYLNGVNVGSHTGGYLPFSLDVTDTIQDGDNLLQVVVRDLSDTSYHAKGKQSLERGGMWYTAQSGIWQTVWMEHVPQNYIASVKITPDYDRAQIKVKVLSSFRQNVPVHAKITYQGKPITEVDFFSDKTFRIDLKKSTSAKEVHKPLKDEANSTDQGAEAGKEFQSWTPETPNLYDMAIQMDDDFASTYFAMRKVSVEKDKNGILRFFLNNEPYFHNGLLDQGYYPDGLYTAPSDEALQYDIRKMKELGFNMLRKHIKIEPDRWYYHCDRIGMLVWQDMVCGGERYLSKFVTVMPNVFPWTGRVVKDHHYTLFSRKNPEGRQEYYRELKETIKALNHHPSIVAWVPFNEGWGQFDAAKATSRIRRLDPSRLIDEASGWFDQGGGDMYSIHNYFRKLKVRPQKDRVVALTECGGYSYLIPAHGFCEEVYGYRKYDSKKALTDGIVKLWERELMPNLSRGLSVSVYTQVSDIEDEVNGLLTYDREELKVDEVKILNVNKKILREFQKAAFVQRINQ